jgi:TetR/AcrR family transcriptional regulator
MGTRERKGRELESRRQLILATAKDLFVRNGFAGVTLDDIASVIEFSKGTIYNHFGSKEEIYATILLDHLAILRSELREAGRTGRDTSERVANAMRAYVKFYREHREFFRLLFFFDVVSDHVRIQASLLKRIRLGKIACLHEVQAIIREGLEAGEVGGGPTVAEISLLMWGTINGIIHLAESRQIRLDDLDRLIAVGYGVVLAGLRAPAFYTS